MQVRTYKKYYLKINIFILKNKIHLYIKKYRWIRIIHSKIKHKQNNVFKKILSKKGMQNMWSSSWDLDRPIKQNSN
jgi:hypothetical protein